MAVKKKSAAKKVAKKAAAKRVVKKTAKRAVAKKRVAKKAVAKKRVTKKGAAKKTAAKRVVKKTAKKRVAKKAVAKKRVVKKAPAKRVAKKAAVRVAAPRVAVSTTPAVPKPVALAPKPVAAPKQGTSGRVIFLVVAGIVILAAIVMSQSGNKSDDGATPAPSISQSAEPTESASAEPTEPAAPVAAVEAPSKFVALKSADGLKLRWIAPMATDGLTGYNVEVRANGAGDWMVIATVPADQLTQNVTKSGDMGWTQFRVTSVYSDGQSASATVFGIPGEFK
ncbi:MAG: hypothetical protein D4R50_04305 [Actinomycetales bacterium]|nr:MAG: hypothetical protein D4R50_04305 [Actinomycetales bacterium]